VAFPGIYLTQFITPKLRFGISLNAPYGGYLNYNDGWVGRYKVQYTQLSVIDLNPVLSYRIHERVALGGGIVVEYANLRETIALPLPFPFEDGQINLKVQNYSAGYNLGALILLNRTARLGISYRSKINHNLKGKLTFLRIPFAPGVTTNVTMPQNVIISVVDDIHPCISLLGEVGWSNWSVMKNSIVNVAGFTGQIPLDWRNTYRVGIGGAYHANHFITLQSGISYDSSPTNSKRRLPNLPMDKQVRVGAGVMFTNFKGAQIGLSYEYINFGRARINNVGSVGQLSGAYTTNYANVVQASINVAL
jgi:long-chain fatty acid transport protein